MPLVRCRGTAVEDCCSVCRWPVIVAAALFSAAPATAVVSVVGRTSATMRWTPAAGAVTAYHVFVSRNGAPYPALAESHVSAPSVTLNEAWGASLRLRVRAVDAQGNPGPLSEESERVVFAPSASDVDADGVANLVDVCPEVPDRDQADADADGVGNACDACTTRSWSPLPLRPPDENPRSARVMFGDLTKSAGAKLTLSGIFSPAPDGSGFDAALVGLHLRIDDGLGVLLDVEVPPGSIGSSPCDPRDGWKVRGSVVSYVNRSGAFASRACAPGSAAGVRSVTLSDRRPKDGIRYAIKLGPIALARTPEIPVRRVRVALALGLRSDPDEATFAELNGQCAELRLTGNPLREKTPGPYCRPSRSLGVVRALGCVGP